LKKTLSVLGIACLMATVGCSNDASHKDVYEESGHSINVNNKRNELYNEKQTQGVRNMSNDFGYVRHQKSPVMGDAHSNGRPIAMNREQLAHVISSLGTDLPNINDIATLVTDQEVLIAYDTDAQDRNRTADMVKRTAMSVVPRYYHVYVSDNKRMFREVENLSHLESTSRGSRHLVDNLIKEMKKSPQGAPMNASENANGETPDDHTKMSGNNTGKSNNNMGK
jgi:hypothetical protein